MLELLPFDRNSRKKSRTPTQAPERELPTDKAERHRVIGQFETALKFLRLRCDELASAGVTPNGGFIN